MQKIWETPAQNMYYVSEYIYYLKKMFFITWDEVLPNMEAHSYCNYIFFSKYLTNLLT